MSIIGLESRSTKKVPGRVLSQGACPNPGCDSHDAFTTYAQDNGKIDAYCFSCDTYFDHTYMMGKNEKPDNDESKLSVRSGKNFSAESPSKGTVTDAVRESKMKEALDHPIRELKERGISFSTADRYGVRVGVDTRDGTTPTYYLFPQYKDGDLSGFVKKNLSDKSFSVLGNCKGCDPFGLHLIPQKGKKLFITEGVEDCLSVYQVLKENSTIDWEPAVIALQGAKAKLSLLEEHLEQIDSFQEIVIILDNDAPGKEAAKELAKMFAGKSFIVTVPAKDPNDMLMSGRGEELKWLLLTGAKKYHPDGIVNAKDAWERYKSTSKVEYYPFPDFLPELNRMLYGLKAGTVFTLAGGTSLGKTTVIRALKHHFLKTTNHKIADIELEADVVETLQSLVGLELGKRITLPDVEVDPEEEANAYQDLFSSGRYTLYDFFGGMDDDTLFSKLRYLANAGNKFIFIDHLSIIVSEYAAQGGERERIDTIMTKLAKLAKETNTCIVLIVHLKKSENSKVSFEQGAIPDLDDLRGSSTIKQLSWDVVFIARNTQHPSERCSRITEIISAKCRLTGRTGNAGFIEFDDDTGRYHAVQMPTNYRYKPKKSNDEF